MTGDWIEKSLLRALKAKDFPVFLPFIRNWENDFTLGAYNLTAANLSRRSHATTQSQPTFYGHYTGQPALAGTFSQELEDFVGAKIYCPHALADGKQRIGIREKTLERNNSVMYTVSVRLSIGRQHCTKHCNHWLQFSGSSEPSPQSSRPLQ